MVVTVGAVDDEVDDSLAVNPSFLASSKAAVMLIAMAGF